MAAARPGNCGPAAEASGRELLRDGPLPRVAVFDLDHTLWPLYCDCNVTLPVKAVSPAAVVDTDGKVHRLHDDVPSIIQHLRDAGVIIAIASRSAAKEEVDALLDHLHIGHDVARLPGAAASGSASPSMPLRHAASVIEVYPGCKKAHFERIHAETGVAYRDMVFFDDEHRNIVDISALGVTAVFIRRGMGWSELCEGIQRWRAARA